MRPDDYHHVAQRFSNAQGETYVVMRGLLQVLRDNVGAAGCDDAAHRFNDSYQSAARQVVSAFATLHHLLGGIARGLDTSAGNHWQADAESTPGSAESPTWSPVVTNDAVNVPDVPTLVGPGESWIPAVLQRYWPSGDRDRLYALSRAFDSAKQSLEEMATDLHNHLKTLAANNCSEDLDALEEFWNRVGGQADSAILSALPRALDAISRALADYSEKIQQTHEQMLDAVKEVAVEVLGAAALAIVGELLTGGLASLFAGPGGELVLSRVTARLAAVAGQLLTALGGSIAIAGTAEAAAGLAMAISSTPDPNIEATEAARVADSTNEPPGGQRLRDLDPDTRQMVDETIQRAKDGKAIFQKHDGKIFDNYDRVTGTHPLPDEPAGYYREWTVARPGMKRGAHRIIIGGDPANPDVIYYWDHGVEYIRIYP
ncbi:hypothetical protein GTS_46870 [Gandjariella thermophila]|uniref:Outer membrane channel protein CpnT-like N-terminal domain-containing protein n=1 Tax=Gandjariella thermophila TaxID=1931992 RepID=A0A4D4JBU0_9PSEU|nr:hypothetical protein GTS_46870 [Gandjariella thermophila]